ncbi:MAG: hypothetical protein A2X22_02320 [Bacteroidetes bacterium GWF2_49_14]|nr:MAG: hypothetical protein A2X22_02320 [Bacteroidetes bacterium GWF2_49_14]
MRPLAFSVCLILMAGCSGEIDSDHHKEISGRVLLDFRKTEEQVRQQLSRYYPYLSDSQMRAWESDGRLEMKVIEGQKKYFNYAVNNLFRIDPVARKVRDTLFPPKPDPLDSIRLNNTGAILLAGQPGKPAETLRITYEFSIIVDKDAVPDGESIRCWLPYPGDFSPRQRLVNIITSTPAGMQRSSSKAFHTSLYAEQKAVSGEPAIFSYTASFDISGQWFDPGSFRVKSGFDLKRSLKAYTGENPPQIIFSPAVKRLADSLAGNETDPYKIIRSYFYWIDRNIPWASAREYSTMDSIPDYVLKYRHGDCGMVTFLLMSMARYKGIPARWQSGWMLHPGEENLHDWCEIWFEGAGWVPVDMSFGLQNSEDNQLREFYITGIDSYRMIVNSDFGRSLEPSKKFFRSEPYDFQRGEVEWSGGNLYFNHWDYQLKIVSIEKIYF